MCISAGVRCSTILGKWVFQMKFCSSLGINDDEWLVMRKHPVYAFDMLSPISFLHKALDIHTAITKSGMAAAIPEVFEKTTFPLPPGSSPL